MLQIVVDDADEFHEFAKVKGLEMKGPMLEHGEKIDFFKAPSGMAVPSIKD